MINNSLRVWLMVFGLFLVLSVPGCNKRSPVTSYSYEQEMINYITNSQEGQELYSFYLFPNRADTFSQFGYTTFYDITGGHRAYEVYVGTAANMYGYTGVVDAIVRVNDTLYGTINRIMGSDTTIYRYVNIAVTRYAYFLKLFSDDYPYRGWRFWGYGVDNLDPSHFGTLKAKSGATFSAFQSGDIIDTKSTIRGRMGFYFVFKNNMTKLPPGDSLTYTSSTHDYLYATKNDGVTRNIKLISASGEYTGGWKIPSGSDKFYRLITFEGLYDERLDTMMVNGQPQIYTLRVRYSDVVIPFKVDI
jgi:hypothetical protein